jgi:hypothetical protein
VGVQYPTVAIGIGPFGGKVVDRLTDSLDSEEPLLAVVRCEPDQLQSHLSEALHPLLEAGRTRHNLAEPRLDLMAFALGMQGGDDALVLACEQAARVVGQSYGALFPPNKPPGQRTAGLQLVIIVPPLTSAAAAPLQRRLAALEKWAADDPPYPLLTRIWLLSTHTRSGTLSVDDAISSASAFGIALMGSGLRAEDMIAARMSHHSHGEGLFSFFSAASLDLPKARLRQYSTERVIYDGMAALVTRVEEEVDPGVALSAVSALRHDEWLVPFVDGEPARRCRQLAANLSGATAALPSRIKVGPFDEAEDIRQQYAILFRPATQVRPPTHADISALDEMIVALDRAESTAFQKIRGGLSQLYAATLGPKTGLRELPMVEAGMRRVLASLQDEDAREATLGDAGPGDADPLRAELEAALEILPSRGMLWAVAGTVGAAATVVLMLAAMGVTTELDMDVTYHESAVNRARLAAWLVPLFLGALISYGFARWTGSRSRKAVKDILKKRRDAINDLWRAGGGGQPGRQAEAQLRQRRLRVRRGAIRTMERALEHLQAVRRALLEARDGAHRRLSELCPHPQPDPSLDDLTNLLGTPRPLHAPLVNPQVANWWVRSCREIADLNVWANRLLEGAWPPDGLAADLPCADPEVLYALGRKQTMPLVERNLFGDPQGADAAALMVSEFTERAPRALARPCEPVDEHGDPVMGIRPGEIFAVAPVDARSVLKSIFDDAPISIPALWTTARAERVIFVRTWEGYTLADVGRAVGFKEADASA